MFSGGGTRNVAVDNKNFRDENVTDESLILSRYLIIKKKKKKKMNKKKKKKKKNLPSLKNEKKIKIY